ncbi:MAG: hypothetical protein LBT33_07460 [Spirochaetia bacterium]|jgi:hypothetical protein|nr:hypothetical protein [Spirochaetia bacterium]
MEILEFYSNEIKNLKDIFKKYKNKYIQLKKDIGIEEYKWARSFCFNIRPLEVELAGNKKGVLLKNEPHIKKNAIQYGFKSGEIISVLIYGQQNLLSEKMCFEEKNRKIILGFGNSYDIKNLDKVYIINYDKGKNPINTLSWEIDDEEYTFVNETYEYENKLINKIIRKGFITEDGEIETIIDYEYLIEYDGEIVIVITGKSNILKNRTERVYSN